MRSPASYSSSFRSGCCCSRRRHCEERRVHPWPLLSVWGRLRSAWRCSQHTGAAEPCLLFECDSPESTSISVLNLFVDKVRPRAAFSMPVQRPLPQPNRSKLHISKQTSERTSTQHKKVRARTDSTTSYRRFFIKSHPTILFTFSAHSLQPQLLLN